MYKLLLASILILLIISPISSDWYVASQKLEKLKVSVKLMHKSQDSSKVITMQGRVMEDGEGVRDSLVSVQVSDPNEESVHIALTYTNETGHFHDEFILEAEAIPGNYSLYLTASKMGYEDTRLEIPFTLYADFNLLVSPKFLELKPGEAGNVTVEAVPGYPEEISLRLVTCPKFVKCNLIPIQIKPEGNATLYLNVSSTAPQGIYNVTIAGITDGKIRHTNFTLSILKVEEVTRLTTVSDESEQEVEFELPLQNVFYIIIGVFLSGIIASVILVMRLRRKRKGVDLSYMSTARAIAKLEELKALGKIDDETYERLKREYEAKL